MKRNVALWSNVAQLGVVATAVWFVAGTASPRALAAETSRPTYLLPLTCAELLPDNSPYIGFLEAVALGSVHSDRNLSRRILRVLALRTKVAESGDRARENNPIDFLIRKTLCFYREQREPLKPVPFDDAAFAAFLKGALKDLELKVEDAVYQLEFERAQRKQYEAQLQANRDVLETVRNEAEQNAEKSYERLSSSARQKVKTQ